MKTIKYITNLDDFVSNVELFKEGYRKMNKKGKVFEMNEEGYLKILLGIMNTSPKNGLAVVEVDGAAVGFGACYEDTPDFALERELLLWALYVKPQFSGEVLVYLFDEAVALAKRQGFRVIKSFNSRFSGAMYRLFEDKLGMKRHRVQFNKNI